MSRAGWRLPLLLALTLTAAETYMRACAPMYQWISRDSDDYAQALWRARRAPAPAGAPILTIIGNSGAREDVDQDVLGRELGLPAYNWGMSAETIEGIGRFPLAAGNGGILLLGLSVQTLETRHLPGEPDLRYPWRRPFMSWLTLYRDELAGLLHSRLLRLADADGTWTGRETFQHRYDAPMDEAGERRMWTRVEALKTSPAVLTEAEAVGVLAKLVERGRAAGYQVCVFWLPAHPDAPAFARDNARTTAARALLSELGVPQYSPPRALLQREDFFDLGHLLASGRARFTLDLARFLKGLPR